MNYKLNLMCLKLGVWLILGHSVHVRDSKNDNDCCHQMAYLKTIMHQIQFRLGLCPGPQRKTQSAPPDSLPKI